MKGSSDRSYTAMQVLRDVFLGNSLSPICCQLSTTDRSLVYIDDHLPLPHSKANNKSLQASTCATCPGQQGILEATAWPGTVVKAILRSPARLGCVWTWKWEVVL